MGRLEHKIDSMEATNKMTIQEEISSIKDGLVQDIKGDLNNLVDQRTKELELCKNKETNIILFNAPEDHQLDSKLAKETSDDKPRPLIVKIGSRSQRKKLLENARRISQTASPDLKRVILMRDLTKEQRKELKEKDRKANAKDTITVTPAEMETNATVIDNDAGNVGPD